MSAESSESAAALELVHQGWSHLQRQRPQAAWAAWQRALRRVPEFPAATQALETLEAALELPAAARAGYRFQPPEGAACRARWNERFAGRAPDDLDDAVAAFASLAAADPADAAAAYNEGLCLAWLGRNREAIGALDRAVRLLASTGFDRAVEAWALAEVLRQGGDAEPLADDLSYAWVIEPADPDAVERLAGERRAPAGDRASRPGHRTAPRGRRALRVARPADARPGLRRPHPRRDSPAAGNRGADPARAPALQPRCPRHSMPWKTRWGES